MIIDAFVPSWTMFTEQLPDSGYQMVFDGDDKMAKGEQERHHSKLFCFSICGPYPHLSYTYVHTFTTQHKHTLLREGLSWVPFSSGSWYDPVRASGNVTIELALPGNRNLPWTY